MGASEEKGAIGEGGGERKAGKEEEGNGGKERGGKGGKEERRGEGGKTSNGTFWGARV